MNKNRNSPYFQLSPRSEAGDSYILPSLTSDTDLPLNFTVVRIDLPLNFTEVMAVVANYCTKLLFYNNEHF